MNLISYILGALVLILTIVQVWWDYILKHVFKDGRTNDHRKFRKRLLIVTLLLLLLNQISGVINNFQKDKSASGLNTNLQSLKEANQTLTNQVQALTNQITTISSRQLVLAQQYQSLINQLSTNSSIELNLRQKIVDANRTFEVVDEEIVDLNAWQAGLRARLDNRRAAEQISEEKKLKAQQAVYEDNLPYCDYSIKKLIELVNNVATQKGDKCVSAFNGLPKFIPPEIGTTNIAEIKLQNNSDWDFRVFFGAKEWNGRRGLHIECKGGSLVVWISVQPSGIETWLEIPGEQRLTDSQPVEDYKKIIPSSLGNLFAAVYERNATAKK